MTDSPAAIGLGFLAYFALTLLLLAAAAVWRHRDARLEPVPSTGARDGSGECNAHRPTCVAPLCCETATIRLSVGHDYWPLCIGHGLPILTQELTS